MPYADAEKQKQYFLNYRSTRRRHYTELSKQWRVKNPDRYFQNQKQYRDRNRELLRLKARIRYWKDPQAVLRKNREYAASHPHLIIRKYSRRSSKIKSSPEEWPKIKTFVKSIRNSRFVTCYYCERRTPGKTAHIDHVIPVANGGLHVASNLCCACPSCNLMKQARLPDNLHFQPQQLLVL